MACTLCMSMESLIPVLLRSVYRLGLTIWVGGTIFFSAYVLPTLFTRLGRAQAGEIASVLFPGYYWIGTVLGGVLVVCCLWLVRSGGLRWVVPAAVVAVMFGCTVYAAFVVHPRIAPLRGVVERQAEFDALHRLSVRLNGVVMLGGVLLVLGGGRLGRRRPDVDPRLAAGDAVAVDEAGVEDP